MVLTQLVLKVNGGAGVSSSITGSPVAGPGGGGAVGKTHFPKKPGGAGGGGNGGCAKSGT